MFTSSDLLWCLLALALYTPFVVVCYIEDAKECGRYFALQNIHDKDRQFLSNSVITSAVIAIFSYGLRVPGIRDVVDLHMTDSFVTLMMFFLAYNLIRLYGSVVVTLYHDYVLEPRMRANQPYIYIKVS